MPRTISSSDTWYGSAPPDRSAENSTPSPGAPDPAPHLIQGAASSPARPRRISDLRVRTHTSPESSGWLIQKS